MKKEYIIASILLLVAFILPILIMNWLYADKNIWSGLALGVAGTFEEYCERNRMEAFLRERMNSWSNLVFIWFGLVCMMNGIFTSSSERQDNIIHQYPILSIFTGLSFLYLGIGSFLYHAALTKFTQLLDVAGTYAAMTSVIYLGVLTLLYPKLHHRSSQTTKAVYLLLLLTILADILLYKYKWQISSSVVLPIMIGLLIGIVSIITNSKQMKGNMLLAIAGFISVVLAFFVRTLDVKKVLCYPDSWLQGHAIWHVLTATSLFLMYYYFRGVRLLKE